jgi:hypothetical protein
LIFDKWIYTQIYAQTCPQDEIITFGFQKIDKYAILESMETLIHADIFFFISTIWMVIISAIAVFILWNVALIIKDLIYISRKIREGSDVVSQDLHDLHTAIRTEGANIKSVSRYFKHLFSRRQNHKK